MSRPAWRPPIFVDRDGTLIEEVDYLRRLEQMRLLPGAAEAVRAANAAGHPVIVVTNQSAVARGIISEDFARESEGHLRRLLAVAGAHLDGYYYCPFHPDGQPPYDREHPDRKPGAGMLLRAARDLNWYSEQSESEDSESEQSVPEEPSGVPRKAAPEDALRGAWMIGDKRSDLETGAALGVVPLLVRTGYGAQTEAELPPDFERRGGRVFDDLSAAIGWILAGAAEATAAQER